MESWSIPRGQRYLINPHLSVFVHRARTDADDVEEVHRAATAQMLATQERLGARIEVAAQDGGSKWRTNLTTTSKQFPGLQVHFNRLDHESRRT